jgi:phosphatidate cytidylyltransferase
LARVLSAAVLVAILGATIWFLPWWATVAVAAAAAALGAHELAALSAHMGAPVPSASIAVASAAVVVALGTAPRMSLVAGIAGDDLALVVVLASLVAAGVLSLSAAAVTPAAFTRAAVMVMAPVYIGLPLGTLAWVQSSAGPRALTWFVALIAVSDSAQYYTGRAFGRRKLAPAISPGKTTEGAVGGLVVAAIAGAALSSFGLPNAGVAAGAALAGTLAIAGMVGDLFESMLKRAAGVKDSSALIPGHGGVLDRIDSYLFAAPIFYVYLIARG